MLSRLIDLLNAANHTTLFGIMAFVFGLTVYVLIHFIPKRNERKAKAAIIITIVLGGAIVVIAFTNSRRSEDLNITGDCNATATGNGNQVSSRCTQSSGNAK